MQRALVIKYGNPEIAGAIVNGMAARLDPPQPLDDEAIKIVQAEIDRQRIQRSLLRVAVGNNKTPEDYACMTAKARCDYEDTRDHGRVYDALLGVWGGLWLAIYNAYDYLSAWNRSE